MCEGVSLGPEGHVLAYLTGTVSLQMPTLQQNWRYRTPNMAKCSDRPPY